MRKQLDPRIPTLIRNNVATGHRSFFVIVGDHGRDQVVNLHFLLSQSRVESRPNVLWCYKKDLGFTTHRKKREAKIKRDIKRGVRDQDTQDPFELFVGVTDIRYCYYKDTPKILGRTFGMLVLQDFEAITPNLLARTIETVEGGGIVVLLLQTMSSLRQLHSLSMDAHRRYRTASTDEEPVARFNERFLLSLSACKDCLLLDDELNVLPVSRGRDIRPLPETQSSQSTGGVGAAVQHDKAWRERDAKLADLRADVAETKVVGDVIKHAKTMDQATAVLTILDVLASSSLSTTVTLTAGRGRGKSAALGLCLAAAIAHGYSNIFVTSPSPENLKTLFEFVLKGLDALGYEEVADWDLQRGTGEWKDTVVRINVFRGHRQTIQYIQPQDHAVLSQAELLVIDEAAAIPLPLVRRLMGPYLVFLSSTINGYEGTGRSLSLKLFQQLRSNANETGGRALKEVELREPIRYTPGDQVEAWLNELLCLDASLAKLPAKAREGCPHPSTCELYMVNRDSLFSFHPASELFLQRIMALYVAGHYKNSPNDLQLLSDAPAHALFVLLPPLTGSSLPEPLCVLQVALEGNISRQAILNSLARGTRDAGDLVPWLITQQFQDADFASLSGARVVRIAVHPEYARMGYGSRALEQMEAFYTGSLLDPDAYEQKRAREAARPAPSRSNELGLRDASTLPPLLERLSERQPESLDWLGVSYGLTSELFKFWKQSGYTPLYIRQNPNELTGEYSAVQLKTLHGQQAWLSAFADDFRKRFNTLLSFKFRELRTVTALSVLEAASAAASQDTKPLHVDELRMLLTPFDMKRLESYGNNLIELQVVIDLLPSLAFFYFGRRLRVYTEESEHGMELQVSGLSAALLLAIGLQRRPLDDIAQELQLPLNQAHTLLCKAVRYMVKNLRALEKQSLAAEVDETAPRAGTTAFAPLTENLEEELAEAGRQALQRDAANSDADEELEAGRRALTEDLLNDKEMSKYAIQEDDEAVWQEAEARVRKMKDDTTGRSFSSTFSIRAKRPAEEPPASQKQDRHAKKSGTPSKKRRSDSKAK
ncbi:N-acetyltransferase 10 [Malassezia pachydermatis]|uniref:RNA cytidine acetyltransferase n=1 Tax=Malassezia pachydermatis TaxID=77020 RepID=A0A0M9VN19_9BASI|nr:hypothetical protein Malapachy_0420 [Malassezia pachydermatis]KOS12889.1 hypothetical protein Malapachy_0420 [Malassezia pachydermatis]